MKADRQTGRNVSDIKLSAAKGVGGAGGTLPYFERIQNAFGRHDISAVQAHVGGAAGEAARAMGAEAYATGRSIAFRDTPTLHTAAHEAAHVVQQRAGLSLDGGVGQLGDAYERHADQVADLVVAGQSAEGLLNRFGGGNSNASSSMVQRSSPELDHNDKVDAQGVATDPEMGDLFDPLFVGGGWDANRILSRMSQLDDIPSTFQDQQRCTAHAILAVHITGGPDSIRIVANSAVRAIDTKLAGPGVSQQERNAAMTLRNAIELLSANLLDQSATYFDLAYLADGLNYLGGGVGTPQTTHEMARIGGGLHQISAKEGRGWQEIQSVFAQIANTPGRGIVVALFMDAAKSEPHAVTLGCDAKGVVYLYDSWPRQGSQKLERPGDDAQIKDYFETPSGQPKVWQTREIIAAAH